MKAGKLSLDQSTLDRLASALLDEHKGLTARGFKLTRASGYWLTKRGDVTARFVYRSPDASAAFTLRKLQVVWK